MTFLSCFGVVLGLACGLFVAFQLALVGFVQWRVVLGLLRPLTDEEKMAREARRKATEAITLARQEASRAWIRRMQAKRFIGWWFRPLIWQKRRDA